MCLLKRNVTCPLLLPLLKSHREKSLVSKRCWSQFNKHETDGHVYNDFQSIPPMPRIMHPDWYRTPMPEDDPRMIGDYPDVLAISHQLRDPYQKYFDQQNRRNFGESLPEDYEPLLMWSFDVEERYGIWWVVAAMSVLFGGPFLLYQCLGTKPSPFANRRVCLILL